MPKANTRQIQEIYRIGREIKKCERLMTKNKLRSDLLLADGPMPEEAHSELDDILSKTREILQDLDEWTATMQKAFFNPNFNGAMDGFHELALAKMKLCSEGMAEMNTFLESIDNGTFK